MKRTILAAAAIVTAGLAAPAPLSAQEKVEPKGIVAYRIAVMRTLGAQMMAIKTALTETPEFRTNILWHGQIIADASKNLVDLFPEGSNEPPSTTLDVVWQKWSDFEAAAGELEKLSAAFLDVASRGNPEATLQAFARMGKQGCGGCHENFRRKRGG